MITITIENYQNKKTTYTMPDDGTINIWTVHTARDNKKVMDLTNVTLELMHPNKIEVKGEINEQEN